MLKTAGIAALAGFALVATSCAGDSNRLQAKVLTKARENMRLEEQVQNLTQERDGLLARNSQLEAEIESLRLDPATLLRRTREAIDAGQLRRAERLVEEIRSLHPGTHEANVARGYLQDVEAQQRETQRTAARLIASIKAKDCTYMAYAAGPKVNAAKVRPVIGSLSVTKGGPGTQELGTLDEKPWVEAIGACGDWIKIGFGYGEGWIYEPLTCQEALPMILATPMQARRDAIDRPVRKYWQASAYHCEDYPRYNKSDEEIAAEGIASLLAE